MSDDSSAPDAAARVTHGQGKETGGGEFRFCRLAFDGSVAANLFKDFKGFNGRRSHGNHKKLVFFQSG